MGTSFGLLDCELGRGIGFPLLGSRLCRMGFWWECKIDFWWELAFGAMPQLFQVELCLVPPLLVDPLLRIEVSWLGMEGLRPDSNLRLGKVLM